MKKITLYVSMVLVIFATASIGDWLHVPIKLNTVELLRHYEARFPKVCSEGDFIFVVWEEHRNGVMGIFCNYSLDKGLNWLENDIRIDHRVSTGVTVYRNLQMVSSGSNIYVVWNDDRNDDRDIYLNYSHDRGRTWHPTDINIDFGDVIKDNYSWYPQIACEGDNVYVVWNDYRNGASDIFFNRSKDGGVTWLSQVVRLDVGDFPGIHSSWKPAIVCSGSSVYVTWADARNSEEENEDIYFNCSHDGGDSWLAQDIRLDVGDNAVSSRSLSPVICCHGNNVYVAWDDERNGGIHYHDVYFNRSLDGGVTWLVNDIRINKKDLSLENGYIELDMTCVGEKVYMAWIDHRYSTQCSHVYFNYSKDSGLNWFPQDIRLDRSGLLEWNQCHGLDLVCSGDDVYVAWSDGRDGESDIYMNESNNGGRDWLPYDIRIDTGESPGLSPSGTAQLAPSYGRLYAVWSDFREGTWNIYFNTSPSFNCRLDISCGDGGETFPRAGAHVFSRDTEVTIMASPEEGYAFSHWSGDVDSRGIEENPLTAVMDSDKRIKANFVRQFKLRVSAGNGGTTEPAPGRHFYDVGSRVSVAAISEEGFRFGYWTGDVSKKKNPVSLRMNSDLKVRARFIKQCLLTLGCMEGGTVQPAAGEYTYDRGTKVKLTAVPNPHFMFAGWSGALSHALSPCEMTLWDDASVTVCFMRRIYTPINCAGQRVENRSLFSAVYLDVLSWQPHPDNVDITKYRVYLMAEAGPVLMAELSENAFQYQHKVAGRGALCTYAVVAVNSENREGVRASITINGI